MMTDSERGSINILLIPFILAILLLVGAAAFGGWAYMGRQDYKNNVQTKIDDAVDEAKKIQAADLEKQYNEQEKQPLKAYSGPAAYGSITVNYPKTWSAYVDDDGSSNPYVDGYFHPNVVPGINNDGVSFAVRLEVVSQSYSEVLKQYQTYIKQNKAKLSPFKAVKVPNVIGARLDGQISSKKNGSMVILPLRDKTLKLWTEADQYKKDFNTIILPNFTFAP